MAATRRLAAIQDPGRKLVAILPDDVVKLSDQRGFFVVGQVKFHTPRYRAVGRHLIVGCHPYRKVKV